MNDLNIASTAGIKGVPRAPAYSASKAGVILLTKSLALEWARYNIRVNAIAPHYLETPLTEGLRASEKVYSGLVKQIPIGLAYQILKVLIKSNRVYITTCFLS
jgi:NAD(P)-dependent dehydrogenase (short-subunit alcohol dehydrogenase family)